MTLPDGVRTTTREAPHAGTGAPRRAAPDEELLAALALAACGARLAPDDLADQLGLSPDAAAAVLDRARATGLLGTDDALAPATADEVREAVGPDRLAAARPRVLSTELHRGRLRLPLARELARDGLRDPQLARYLVTAADAELADDPVEAAAIYREAVVVGADAAVLAARRAEASVRAGDLAGAGAVVDEAWPRVAPAGVPALVRVGATVSALRGVPQLAAELYRYLGPERAGLEAPFAAVVLWAAGDRAGGDAMAAVRPGGPPTSVSAGLALLADGVDQSLREDPAVALNTLSRAATLLRTADRTLLTPDSGAAVAALAALHAGELDRAETVLRRALDAEPDHSPSRCRHELLLGWVAMLRGDLAEADRLAAAVARHGPGYPRDELFLRALVVGTARRSSDLGALTAAWAQVQDVLGEHSPDLFSLLPLAELQVAAARLHDTGRTAPLVAEALDLLTGLGEPVLWASALHWAGVHAAIHAERPADLVPHATALSAASHHSPYAAALAMGGQAWLRVLSGRVTPEEVERAARALARYGLSWDGSRLAGQAALRTADSRAATTLLHVARSLAQPTTAAVDPAPEGGPATEDTGLLSDREREVAALVLMGMTYRDIGAQLFISAKTVEHHVSRMRRRLGASSRRELLSMLRAAAGGSEQA